MSTLHLTLGDLVLSSMKDDIMLIATATGAFLCEDAGVATLTTSQLLRTLRDGRTVAKRGPGCRIVVEVDFEGVKLGEEDIEEFTHDLGHTMCRASWWSQLPICPSMTDSSSDYLIHDGYYFFLDIADTLPEFLPGTNGNASGNATQDIRVPDGVPVVEVKSVAITLRFQHIEEAAVEEQVARETMELSFEEHLQAPEDLPEDHQLSDEKQCERLRRDVYDASNALKPWWAIQFALPTNFDLQDQSVCDDFENISMPSLTPDISPFQSQESELSYRIQSRDHQPENEREATMDKSTAQLLTDVAMRTFIGGAQYTPTSGVRLSRPFPRHTFAALMPLLFSPDFSSVMSQRSRFLPTITQAMSVLALSAQSPSLQAKLSQLSERSLPTFRAPLAGAVQAHAYRIMHSSLFDPKSARRLCVEDGDKENAILTANSDDSMIIDRSAVTVAEVERLERALEVHSPDPDFEDMLDEEPLSDEEIDMLLDLEIMRQQRMSSCSLLFSARDEDEPLQEIRYAVGGEEEHCSRDADDASMIENWEGSGVPDDLARNNGDMLF